MPKSGIASAVIDSDTLRLDDGTELRLAGILAPKPVRRDRARAPLAEAATALLGELAIGQRLELRPAGSPRDRYGRLLAQAYRADGTWLQGEMLRRGLARVDSRADDCAGIPDMLAPEREARAASRGLWADPAYRIRAAAETPRFIDSFQIVEGTVVDAVKVKGQVFLNFGPDWRTDFTIRIPGPALKLFRAAKLDPLALKGQAIRGRGWLRAENGPMLDAACPEAIEILGP